MEKFRKKSWINRKNLGLTEKIYGYLIDGGSDDKKEKWKKKHVKKNWNWEL